MPYKSAAQRGYFNANREKLEAQGVSVDEWNEASKGKKLPKRVKRSRRNGQISDRQHERMESKRKERGEQHEASESKRKERSEQHEASESKAKEASERAKKYGGKDDMNIPGSTA